jgi:putative tricarboxylic transport membrane protein
VKQMITRALILAMLTLSHHSLAIEKIHFLIPNDAGGGQDSTARSTGEALLKSGLISRASYENMSGGDGSKAISHLIETAERQTNTLMITSTPIILRSLKNIFPQSYKDLTAVSTVVADFGAFVVRADSKYVSWRQVVEDVEQDPRNVKISGGSVKGGLDHVVVALAFKKSGVDARLIRYIPFNAGAKAMVSLLSGETEMLSTGLGEALPLAEQGEIRILAITAAERHARAPNVPTLTEQGIDLVFTNWRGFFAAPNLAESKVQEYHELLTKMYQTPEWEQIRQQRGWSNLHITGKAFVEYLSQQEEEMAALMKELGVR